jgi:methyltransferase (TIGR00027 family)
MANRVQFLICVFVLMAGAGLATGTNDGVVLTRGRLLAWIRTSADKTHFVCDGTDNPFVPWGFNYDHDEAGRLLEDYWADDWAKVADDFHAMKSLGANVVRIHFQLCRFMKSPEQPDEILELGAGYNTRTVQLQHNHRIRCFEVDLPRTQQLKLKLLHQCGVDTNGVTFVSANFLTDDWLDNLVKAGFEPRKPAFFLWEGVTYYLSRAAMEKTFRTIATIAPGSVVVFDYGTDAVNKMYRKPLGRFHKAVLQAVRESQTFWISSEPPVKDTLATLMNTYGLSLREHLGWGHETKRKRLLGGLAAAVVLSPKVADCRKDIAKETL